MIENFPKLPDLHVIEDQRHPEGNRVFDKNRHFGEYALTCQDLQQSVRWMPVQDFKRLDLSSVLNFYPDYYEDTKTEKIWLNTDEGLIIYDPVFEKNYDTKFSTLIREVNVNDDSSCPCQSLAIILLMPDRTIDLTPESGS